MVNKLLITLCPGICIPGFFCLFLSIIKKQLIMTRQEHNLEICQKLTEFFSNPNHKDLRFLQGLAVMEVFDYSTDTGFVVDPFNTESSKTNNDITNFLTRYETILNHK